MKDEPMDSLGGRMYRGRIVSPNPVAYYHLELEEGALWKPRLWRGVACSDRERFRLVLGQTVRAPEDYSVLSGYSEGVMLRVGPGRHLPLDFRYRVVVLDSTRGRGQEEMGLPQKSLLQQIADQHMKRFGVSARGSHDVHRFKGHGVITAGSEVLIQVHAAACEEKETLAEGLPLEVQPTGGPFREATARAAPAGPPPLVSSEVHPLVPKRVEVLEVGADALHSDGTRGRPRPYHDLYVPRWGERRWAELHGLRWQVAAEMIVPWLSLALLLSSLCW